MVAAGLEGPTVKGATELCGWPVTALADLFLPVQASWANERMLVLADVAVWHQVAPDLDIGPLSGEVDYVRFSNTMAGV
jgi:hypothetical protein